MKVVIDDKIPFAKGVLEKFAQVKYLPGGKICREDLRDTDALIVRTRTQCDAELLDGTPVKFIATATIGHDHIDSGYCGKKGIKWTNAAGCNSASVAQYMAAALLWTAVRHNIALKGRTLGIVGVGNVGSKVDRVARALGMNTILNDPPRHEKEGSDVFFPLAKVLKESDFVTLHTPLTEDGKYPTHHMADASFFTELSRRPFFINASRGEVTDTNALKTAIEKKQVAGAILDVWENEPDIDHELLGMTDIATPHIAGYSTDGKANGTSMSINALAEFFGIDELKGWRPSEIPVPQDTKIHMGAEKLEKASFEEIMLEATLRTYDLPADDRRLGESPETFESQRGSYPLRREFPSYTVSLAKSRAKDKELELRTALEGLGFKVSCGE